MTDWNNVCYVHVDLDAFFASVEQLDHPEYRGKPVIVGGNPKDRRGVVSTASYEARKFGIHSAMPTFKAYSLCPQGIFVPTNMKRYHELSQQVMNIFSNYSPEIRQISIDEAFIDLCGTEKLFGNPSETARKIKAEVKEKTGLTVSAGLAQNKYLAKIASGLSKPDGFFEIPPGTEEKFMLSLPLEKVWGIGSKTQAKLISYGLDTTEKIHSRSLALLQSILGKAGGAFLYDAVRGKEVETFSEAKSHSISAETTFPFDLTDRYAIETALLELSDTVMFRLLKQNQCSKTAALKIRYGDFSTITVQETCENDILSCEDLFERVKRLFAKKYNENAGGIRLLGVGVQNIGNSLYQSEFFNEKSEKKRKLEQSILAIKTKNPDITIKKARLLKNGGKLKSAVLAFLMIFTFSQKKLSGEELNKTQADGAGAIIFNKSDLPPDNEISIKNSKIFSYPIKDKNVEFFAKGYWQSELTGGLESSFGFGNSLKTTTINPAFTQKVDLSLWFMLNRKWYFEAAFADGFEKNTVAAGYYGEGILKEARIANRGISFPTDYSIENINRGIGGGNNQAPGFSMHFENSENSKWKGDIALRYDMLESRNKTYYGHNSVSDKEIHLSQWVTGQVYVLPDNAEFISDVAEIFVESSNGSYSDLQGRSYKKLSVDQYMLFPAKRIIILSKDAGATAKKGIVPAVAVSFIKNSTYSAIVSALGTFGTVSENEVTGESGFLGEIQKYFGQAADSEDSVKRPNVASFSYGGLSSSVYKKGSHPVPDKTGTKTEGFFSYIGGTSGKKVMFLQHPSGFSPFAAAFRYDGGTSSTAEAVIASKTTQTESQLYSAAESDDINFTSKDFFTPAHSYIDVFPSNAELSVNSAVHAAIRFPLADRFPGFYLGFEPAADLYLRLRSYSPVLRFDIGTQAVPGTVRLYKNGNIDSSAKYDSETGTVTPSASVSDSDRIFITWYEDNESGKNGAIAGAAGYARQFTPNLSGNIALSTRWTTAKQTKFADESTSAPGFATAAANLSYKTQSVSISNTVAATLENDNLTGKYRILGMDDESPETVYLKSSAGKNLPDGYTPMLNSSTNIEFPTLLQQYNGSLEVQEGSNDAEITGYKIPVDWDFSSWKGTDVCAWASVAIDLGSAGSNLRSATEFSIALKPDLQADDYDVYLQLGVSAEDDFDVEDSGTIPTWKISDSTEKNVSKAYNPFIQTFAGNIVKIKISEKDRTKFYANQDARIIIVVKNITDSNKTGRLWIGPYEIQTQGVFTSQSENLSVTSSQTTSNLLSAGDFNTSDNYVQNVEWTNSNDTSADTEKTEISISKYFSEVDISLYKEISLFFKFDKISFAEKETDDSQTAFSIMLDREAEGISGQGKKAVLAEIPASAFKNYADSLWHKLTIDRISKKLYIDGQKTIVNSLYLDSSIIPSRLKLKLNTAFANQICTRGTFSFDELHLSGSKEHYIFENQTEFSYKKTGIILAAGMFPLLKDFSLETAGRTASTVHKIAGQENENTFSGKAAAEFTLADIKFSGDISRTTDSSQKISAAGHKIQSEKPLLGFFSGTEEYRYNSVEKTLDKRNEAELNFEKFHLPVIFSAKTQSVSNPWLVSQNSTVKSDIKMALPSVTCKFSTTAGVFQKILPSSENAQRLSVASYSQGWQDSLKTACSTGKENASRRSVFAEASSTFSLPFANFAPQAVFSTKGEYRSLTSVAFEDSSSISFLMPFTVGSSNFQLKWTKEAGGTKSESKGGDYSRDAQALLSAMQNRTYFLKAMPVFDMFATQLANSVLSDTKMTADSLDSLYYTTNYTASWKRPVFGTEKDLFIPAGISISAQRDIRTSAQISDIYQYRASVNYSAFNIFGESGILKKTKLFKQDEYLASFSFTAKIPKNGGEKKHAYSGYLQSNFYYNTTDSVRFGSEINYEEKNIWAVRETISWKRKGLHSPLLGLFILFYPKKDYSEVVLTRSDSLNFSISENTTNSTTNSKVIRKHSFELNHSLDMKMTNNMTVLSSLAESYNCTWNSIILLNITASVGIRIEF